MGHALPTGATAAWVLTVKRPADEDSENITLSTQRAQRGWQRDLYLADALSKLGAEGWEMIGAVGDEWTRYQGGKIGNDHTMFYFKRQTSGESEPSTPAV